MSVLNSQVLDYAVGQIGRRVYASPAGSKGECWDLAFQALSESGAKTPHDYGDTYRWSNQTVELRQALPGDIIQYQRFQITVVTEKKWTDSDENEVTETTEEVYTIGQPRHTAIIRSVSADGKVEVVEQNMGGRSETHANVYYLKAGLIKKGNATIKVSVKGSYLIYRPESKRK